MTYGKQMKDAIKLLQASIGRRVKKTDTVCLDVRAGFDWWFGKSGWTEREANGTFTVTITVNGGAKNRQVKNEAQAKKTGSKRRAAGNPAGTPHRSPRPLRRKANRVDAGKVATRKTSRT